MTLQVSPQTKRVFHLSLPIFAELLLQLLVGNMDQFMISHFGPAAVAAIGNGNQVMNVVIIVLTTMSTAATILLTQHIGAGRVGEECSEIVTVAVTVSAVFSFLVGLFLLLEPELVFQLLRTPEDAFDGACLYTRIVGGTVLLQGLYIQLCAVLRSYTLLKEVVVLSVSMNLLNVVGNAILINGFFGFPQMGVAGAAVSTVISKAVGLTLACITLKRKCTVRFSLQYLHPFPAKTFRALLGIALPSGTEALSYNVSQTFILRFINLMGAAVVSAKVYGSMLANVAYVYSIAVGQATQIILGYMIGGRKLDEVSGRVWSTIRIALAASELLTLLILIFCDPIYSIFTDDPVIHALARQGRQLCYAFLPEAAADQLLNILRLSERTFSSFLSGQCLEAVILGTMFFVSMTLLHFPYALLVGVLIALTALIPIVGAFIGCAVGALLMLVNDPWQALWFIVLFLVLQQIEGNLIYPHVVGSSVGLPSIWVLAAVTVGGSLMGILGMLVFIPLCSVLYALLRQLTVHRLKQRRVPAEKWREPPKK